MYKDKPCVAMIFDRSYLVYDVRKPMNDISDVMWRFKDKAHFVYGGIPRLCYHVEEYKRNLGLNDEMFHKIEIPYCDNKFYYNKDNVAQGWVQEVMSYNPDHILILRDNGHTNETDALVQYAIAHKVHVVEVDNHNHRRDLVDHNGYITKGYYDQTLFGKR